MEIWNAGSRLDRAEAHRKSADWLMNLWHHPDARVVQVSADGELFATDDLTRLRLALPFADYERERHLLIGLVDDAPVFMATVVDDGMKVSLRQIAPLLDDTERDIATTAVALHNWHTLAPYCGACGGYSEVREGGHLRVCTQCGRERYPRMDPAIIVAVRDESDRILLGRNPLWTANRLSLLAGFVEAGESLEQAVVREVAEEVDLEVSEIVYVASQPWPFPRSLMLGFTARTVDTNFSVDGVEIEFADWFARDELAAAIAEGTVGLPGESSIAYRIITSWLTGDL